MYNMIRFKHITLALVLSTTLKLPACMGDLMAQSQSSPHHAATVPLFENIGNLQHPISTRNPLAQRYFNQGLTLAYGFNHAEAFRSFKQAAQLDPNCAMCYWGMAYVLGPNINAAMEDKDVPTAWDAIQKAIALSQHANEKEQAYIQALAKRYAPEPVKDRSALNLAYAKAMRDVAQRYPTDPDAITLFAEALMDTTPWDYWQKDGTPKPEGAEIISTLESVLKRHPNHLGALHLYIHAVESKRPELAVEAADRLRALNIQTGHLVHMPAHIYIRVGRYHDAVVANQKAAEVDRHYHQQHPTEGIYRLGYMPHNHHFLWYAAVMSGQQKVALNAAQKTAELVDPKLMGKPGYGTLQHYAMIPLYSEIKFGLWDKILAEPAPSKDLLYPNGVWHFARGMAFTAKGRLQPAAQELEKLKAIAANPALQKMTLWDINTTADLLQIATEVLAGKLEAKQGNYEAAIAHLQKGVELEDNLKYVEPPPWYSPVRQTLASVLLQANRPAEAERIYREDLKIYPNNGWSLYGLMQSLRAQHKTKEAQAVQQQFHQAWKYADVRPDLVSSVQKKQF
ncbi:tetratricopeptide repeat protein [Fischerella sp. PCC 9605]|uniref:tetratricopeptide repeat protein n=1 Tax=Fischerella sp. PCC 9605 TaxID=1173024 RepID=UPI00047EB2B9|nr:hypothetical protein [Fischerella sp. PCC 9605]